MGRGKIDPDWFDIVYFDPIRVDFSNEVVLKVEASQEFMPTIFSEGPYRFRFYSRDGSEPPHVHVRRDRNHAKFWLAPTQLADDGGFGRTEIRRITRIIESNHDLILEEWYGHFGT